ncbi:MAG: hypothetical protein JSR19_07485 [Proteobacteria bacterium]|nr:hypothetical protein [Pseudomonadota bacterium]HQR03740.1 hypothetical protein [Rhodocyclaceae bacterium]
MASQRLLYVDASRLAAFEWQNGQLQPEGVFALDVPGLEAFAAYLRSRTRSVFRMLVDVVEEGFQIDTLPFVAGNDRTAMLDRRLGQYFFGTPLSAAISLGREKSGRRDEKILFMALTRPADTAPWLAALKDHEIQLAGVYSTPLVIDRLLPRSGPAQPAQTTLVITLSHGGLRQTFLDGGKLRFSRLTPLATGSVEEQSVACALEAAKTYQYLVGQRQVERGVPLQTRVYVHPSHRDTFQQRCHSSDQLQFEFVDLQAQAGASGLKSGLSGSDSSLLLLHLLARNPPAQQLVAEEERHFYRLYQLRHALGALGIIVFLGCAVFAAKRGLDTYTLNNRTAALTLETAQGQQRHNAMLASLPPIPLGPDQLRNVTDQYDRLLKHSPPLDAALLPLSHALDQNPRIQLYKVDWLLSSDPTGKPVQNASALNGSYYAVTTVDATLPPELSNDYKAQRAAVQAFADDLRKAGASDVQLLNQPFDAESSQTIKSDGAAPASRDPALHFGLRVIQNLNPS